MLGITLGEKKFGESRTVWTKNISLSLDSNFGVAMLIAAMIQADLLKTTRITVLGT